MAPEDHRGLVCRSGIWHIDKSVAGVRICKSLRTREAGVAVERYLNEVELANSAGAEKAWAGYVHGMLEDKRSWLHQTHSRISRRQVSVQKGCTLLPPDVALILLRSNGKCEVTGIPFSDAVPAGARIAPFKESIDRIDSSKGYHLDNCRVVCLAVNLAMRDWGEEVMATIGKAMLWKALQREFSGSHAQPTLERKRG